LYDRDTLVVRPATGHPMCCMTDLPLSLTTINVMIIVAVASVWIVLFVWQIGAQTKALA